MCEEAKALNANLIASKKLSLHCEETSALPFSDNSFGLSVALNVIYFLDPPGVHLKEIHRVLKPGGLFLIGYRPRYTVENLAFTNQNFILYEPDELKALLDENGFKTTNEITRSYEETSVDGEEVSITDAWLFKKCK